MMVVDKRLSEANKAMKKWRRKETVQRDRNKIRMRMQRSLCDKCMMVVDKRLADSSREATRRFNKGT